MSQWNLKNTNNGIGCETAWEGTVGNLSVKVAVIDNGIDYNAPDLGGPGFPNLKIRGGYDYFYNDNNPMEDFLLGHGTCVAGIIGALTNNSIHVAGIAGGWQINANDVGASLYAIKMGDEHNAVAPEATCARAIHEAADPAIFGCKVLNASWGGYGYSAVERDAINFAYRPGASFIASKYNGGINAPSYPADFDNNWITSVGGYGTSGLLCVNHSTCQYSSDFGYEMDILAPGNGIVTTQHLGVVTDFKGNSAAAPHVSGAIALIRSIMPNLRNEDTDWMLKFSAFDPPIPTSDGNIWTWNDHYGHGDLRISTVIRRIGHPKFQPYDFITHDIQGGTAISHTSISNFEFIGAPLSGSYRVDQYDVRLDVTYPEDFGEKPFVWVVGDSTIGWSANVHNYQDGWGRVILSTATRTGCQMQTYVYEVFDSNNNSLGWYPCQPSQVSFHYRLWGIQSAGQPNRGGSKLAVDLADGEMVNCSAYPNPFNLNSQIDITLAKDSRVSAEIYDILGRKVRQLIKSDLNAGRHSIIWDGKNSSGDYCPSGVYYCVVKTEQQSSTLKLVLVT